LRNASRLQSGFLLAETRFVEQSKYLLKQKLLGSISVAFENTIPPFNPGSGLMLPDEWML
jgi:hypothetical protein